METRANYVLIGAFALLGILAALGFFLWLAKAQVDKQYAQYDVLFNSVSGLGEAGDVRFNGLPVGQVVSLALDKQDPSKVRVRIEIAAETPVKTDTTATLELQGVTGVAYVSLNGGSPDAPLLREAEPGRIPVIKAEKSAFQSIFEGAPELLRKAISLLENVNSFVTPKNREAVDTILANLSSASGELDSVLKDFHGLSGDLSTAAKSIADFTDNLGEVRDNANTTLTTATDTLNTAQEAIKRAYGAIDNATAALGEARDAFAGANTLIKDKVPALIDQVHSTAGSIETVVNDVGGKASAAIDNANATVSRYDELGSVAIQRLNEAEKTIAALDTALAQADATMKSIQSASDKVDALVGGDGAALVASAKQAVDTANGLMTDRIPGLIDRADAAVATVQTTTAEVGGKIGALADVATARLNEAQATLTQANATLASVQQTSDSVNTLVTGDGAALVAQARDALASADAAMKGAQKVIEEDVPTIVANVSEASAKANKLFDDVGPNITKFSGRLDGLSDKAEAALTTATETFANANRTLDAVTGAMDKAQTTLTSAQKTFDGVNGVIDKDVGPIMESAKSTMANLDKAVGAAAEDLPQITADVRKTLASADKFIADMDNIVVNNSDEIEGFMRAGLPQFVRFTQEARTLVQNLERLTAKIERDPARFLLGTQAPEFRR